MDSYKTIKLIFSNAEILPFFPPMKGLPQGGYGLMPEKVFVLLNINFINMKSPFGGFFMVCFVNITVL